MNNHLAIKPIKCYVENSVLFGSDDKRLTKGKIISINLYEGDAVCFDVLLESGALFSYLPPHKVFANKNPTVDLSLSDLCYINAPSAKASVSELEHLKLQAAKVFLKGKNLFLDAEAYHCTIDWYDDNDLLHLFSLESGHFALIPNHKVLFNQGIIPSFPPYKKLYETWRV